MAFKVKIKNIGKLEDAEVCIGQFTVFAGPNNTGKSFVSKLLYSLFNAMNEDHALVYCNSLLNSLRRSLYGIEALGYKDEKSLLPLLVDEIRKVEDIVRPFSFNSSEKIEEQLSQLVDSKNKMFELYGVLEQRWLSPARLMPTGFKEKKESIENSLSKLSELFEKIKEIGANQFLIHGVQNKILQNLIQNFQVPNLSHIRTQQASKSQVNIDNIGSFAFENGDRVYFSSELYDLRQPQDYSRAIYLESPIYWKLKTALEDTRDYPVHFGDRERLSGVPGYFYDLASALKFEYTGAMAFPDVYAKLTGKSVMDGKIAISETGNLSFQENGNNFSLPVTAMGIANLGILALLIERKVLDKGTFLFIDEPEAHLHPAWQVVMAESLFELSRQGVNVVIATHSVDILKWLEVRVKKNSDDEQLIALNQFPVKNGNTKEDFETKMGKIMHELTKPFSDLYIEGI